MKGKMKSILVIALVLIAAACSAGSGSETGIELSEDYSENALPVETQLIVGTLLLEESNQAIDSEMSSTLLPYWKMYLSLTDSDSAADAEIEALISDIQLVMSQDQIAYIAGLELTQESMLAAMEDLGIMESMRPEGAESDGEGRPEGMEESMPEVMGEGMGAGMDGDIDPETLATMQAERETSGEGMVNSRMTIPLLESLISVLESKAG